MTPQEFKAARKRLKLNQKEFADLLKLNGDGFISKMESGKKSISDKTEHFLKMILMIEDIKDIIEKAVDK